MVEDSADDVRLIEHELKRAGILFQSIVVAGREEFEQKLAQFRPDVVLSDHCLPSFNSVEALKIFKQLQLSLNLVAPFILVTGTVSEEFAVQCIKAGANDYILKDRLKRLPGSILSAIDKERSDAERMRYFNEVVANETMPRKTQQMAKLGCLQADLVSGDIKWSDEAYRLLGYEPGESDPSCDKFTQRVHPEDIKSVQDNLAHALANFSECENEFRMIGQDGIVRYIGSKFIIQRNEENQPITMLGFLLDITEQKEHIQRIEEQNSKLREIAWLQSHGVRAPLARILGLANLLRHRDANTDVNQALQYIVQSIEELDALVRTVVRKTEEIPDL